MQKKKQNSAGTPKQAAQSHLPQPAARIAWIPWLSPAAWRSSGLSQKLGPGECPFPDPAPPAARLRIPVASAPPLASPTRPVVAASAAREELWEDGGLRGSPQTTRRRCPRVRREPRRQRRVLAHDRASWASASLRFLGSGPTASAGAAAAETEAPARLSPPLEPEPGEARRPGWLEGGPLPENGNSLHQDMETVQSPGWGAWAERVRVRESVSPGRVGGGLRILPECGRRGGARSLRWVRAAAAAGLGAVRFHSQLGKLPTRSPLS